MTHPARLIPCLALVACGTIPPPAGDLPFFGGGFRFEWDQCQRVGEDEVTNKYLDHTTQLVACPEAMEDLESFAIDTGATEVGREEGYVFYAVPL